MKSADKMTLDELNAEIDRLKEYRDKLLEKKKTELLEEAEKYGISFSTSSTPKVKNTDGRHKAKVQYKDPETGNFWSGKGPRPKWLKSRLEEGRDLTEFQIND